MKRVFTLLCYFDSPLSWGTNSTQGVESWLIHWVRNWFVTNPEGTNWTGQRVYFGNSYQMWSFCSLVGRKSTSSVQLCTPFKGKERRKMGDGTAFCLLLYFNPPPAPLLNSWNFKLKIDTWSNQARNARRGSFLMNRAQGLCRVRV